MQKENSFFFYFRAKVSLLHLYVLDVLIEFGLALVTLGQEVETDAADVLADNRYG